MGKTKRGKGPQLLAGADRAGLPLAVRTKSAAPHAGTLVAATLEERLVAALPARLSGDRMYASDPLDACLREGGSALSAPPRRTRTKLPPQDGRALRRAKRRWKGERRFAWLGNFRRLVVRYDYHAANSLGFVHLGCLLILLRQYF